MQIHSMRLKKSVIREKRYGVFAYSIHFMSFCVKAVYIALDSIYSDIVIDNVIQCDRTLATRILLNHNGDLVALAVVAGVVG